MVLGLKGFLPSEYNPQGWDYAHATLSEQLGTFGLRSFELDIHYDPAGGRFAKPAGMLLTGRKRHLDDPDWKAPGMKLIHIADFDFNSHHILFKDALMEIRDWSIENPTHLPITIMVELKDFGVGSVVPIWPFTTILPFDKDALDQVDQEIMDVFAEHPNLLFTPDDFRGSHPDLGSARLEKGWPEIDSLRGKILFIGMMGENEQRLYTHAHPHLSGRKMFIFEDDQNPDALFIKIDDPKENLPNIQTLVKSGFIVRTRADADTREARTGDFSRLDSAILSGAQIISTDYYQPDSRHSTNGWSDYRATLPDAEFAIPNRILRHDYLSKILP